MGLLNKLKQISKIPTHQIIRELHSFRYAVTENSGRTEKMDFSWNLQFWEKFFELDMLQYILQLKKGFRQVTPTLPEKSDGQFSESLLFFSEIVTCDNFTYMPRYVLFDTIYWYFCSYFLTTICLGNTINPVLLCEVCFAEI